MMVAQRATIHHLKLRSCAKSATPLVPKQLLADPILKSQPVQVDSIHKDLPALTHICIKPIGNRHSLRHLHLQIKTNRGRPTHIDRSRRLVSIWINCKGISIEIRGTRIPAPLVMRGNRLSPPFSWSLLHHHSIHSQCRIY